ncbi:hypothetical protein F5Y02DRAFT_424386 [Annulohypoxylon stygium]|nr:hypothetical protein F5Y02DRAFT_424386 [Annulohypoxylon stygium]
MADQQGPPFIVVSPPELLSLPIRTKKMAEQEAASTTTSASTQTEDGGDGDDSHMSDIFASDESGNPSTSTAATTTITTGFDAPVPQSPRLQDDMDLDDFDPPFPDTGPDLSTSPFYVPPYVSPGQSTSAGYSYPEPSFTQQLQGENQENETPYSVAEADADGDADAEADAEEDPIPYNPYMAPYPDPALIHPNIECSCPCHVDTPERSGRPRLIFTNDAFLVCPKCWIDAYMTAHGSTTRSTECEFYLRELGKDPMIPAIMQC